MRELVMFVVTWLLLWAYVFGTIGPGAFDIIQALQGLGLGAIILVFTVGICRP